MRITKKISIFTFILVFTSFALYPWRQAEAAITFDAASEFAGDKTLVTSISWSHTSTGSNLVLVVGVGTQDATANDMIITGITYNSVALTKIDSQTDSSRGRSELWYLKAPTTGANTIEVTFTGTVSDAIGGAISLTGVDQTTPLDAQNKNGTDGTSSSLVVTTIADNAWIVDIISISTTITAYTAGGTSPTQNKAWEDFDTLADAAMSYAGPKTPAGDYTLSWTYGGGNERKATIGASFKPAIAGGISTDSQPEFILARGDMILIGDMIIAK